MNIKQELQNYLDNVGIIKSLLIDAAQDFCAVGYYLKQIRDTKLYKQEGFQDIWEMAYAEFGFHKSTTSRHMKMNDLYSVNGDSPELDEKYIKFSKSQLQEMMYLPLEALDQVTPDIPAKEIRDLKPKKEKPLKAVVEQEEVVAPAQQETIFMHFTVAGKGKGIEEAYGATRHNIVMAYLSLLHEEKIKIISCIPPKKFFAFGVEYTATAMKHLVIFYESSGKAFMEVECARLQEEFDYWYPEETTKQEESENHKIIKEQIDVLYREEDMDKLLEKAFEYDCLVKIKKDFNKSIYKLHENNCKAVEDVIIPLLPLQEGELKVDQDTGIRITLGKQTATWAYHPFMKAYMEKYYIRPTDVCITGNAPYGLCSSCHYKGVRCCGECKEDSCNSRCGWLGNKNGNVIDGDFREVPCDGCEHDIGGCCDYPDTQEDYCVMGDKREIPKQQETKISSEYIDNLSRAEIEALKDHIERSEKELEVMGEHWKNSKPDAYYKRAVLIQACELMLKQGVPKKEYDPDLQPELPALKNKDQREEFLYHYKTWPVWLKIEETGETYYRYNLPGGTSIVIRHSIRKAEWCNEEYDFIDKFLLEDEKHFRDCETNTTALIEHLKNVQKKG